MKLNFSNIEIQLALGLSAASALIYEVVATDVLFFYFIESSYSIATVLSVFLLGLGIGSLIIYYTSDRIKNKKLLFGIFQILIGGYALFILTNLIEIVPSISTLGTFTVSFLILLMPTLFLGAIFPLAGSIFKRKKKDIIGLVYSSDLFGAILGTLIAGFILIPFFGSRIAVIFGAGLNIISAFIILSRKTKIAPLIALIILFVSVIAIPSWAYGSKDEYDFYAPSAYGIIKVDNGSLFIGEREQCSRCYPKDTSEIVMVVYALEPHENKSTIEGLNIGLGCGLTLEKALEYNTNMDIVEINYQVVLANKIMTNVLTNPRVNLIVDDGLHYLRNSNKIYDSIMIDVENPTVAHASNLYTVEAFKTVYSSLSYDGTFALWNFNGNNRYLKILYYSLKEAFPYVYSYPWVFLATKQKLDIPEYIPYGAYEINTIDKNTLTDAFLNG